MIDSNRLSDEVFENFSRLTYEKSGIVLKGTKKTLLANRLRQRIKHLGLSSFDEYWSYLKSPEKTAIEIFHFLAAISTNETYFERSPIHFDILQNHILPELYKQHKRRLCIWSCGCSTGEETYNLAMRAIEEEERFNLLAKENEKLEIDIIGTDISRTALAGAEKGEYADRRIAKLSEEQRLRHFIPVKERQNSSIFRKDILKVNSHLREKVNFQYLNLVDDPYLSSVDIIFCRNVLIYFDLPTTQSIIERFTDSLNEGGYLILGHSESLQTFKTSLIPLKMERTTIYQKRQA